MNNMEVVLTLMAAMHALAGAIVHAVGGDFEKSRESEREFMAMYEKVATQAAKATRAAQDEA